MTTFPSSLLNPWTAASNVSRVAPLIT
jgi:hypothetical protein